MKYFVVCLSIFFFFACTVKSPIPDNMEDANLTLDQLKQLKDIKLKLNSPISKDILEGKNKVELILLRNSVFAQHGFEFKTKYIQSYFESRDWYKPGNFDASKLTTIDKENIQIIKNAKSTDGNLISDISELSFPLHIGNTDGAEDYTHECKAAMKPERMAYSLLPGGKIEGGNPPQSIYNGDALIVKGKWKKSDGKITYSFTLSRFIYDNADIPEIVGQKKEADLGPYVIDGINGDFLIFSDGSKCKYKNIEK